LCKGALRKTIIENSDAEVIASFKVYVDCLSECDFYAEKEIFAKGFSIGVKVLAEAFCTDYKIN